MIRHILLWKFTDEVKNNHQEKEVLAKLKQSVETLKEIDGLLNVEMDVNLEENEYDLVFYALGKNTPTEQIRLVCWRNLDVESFSWG